MDLSLASIRHALAEHRRGTEAAAGGRGAGVVAAVALVLAGAERLSLCVIRRAERVGDPWSGHLALPGGRAAAADATARAVAERETREEVGLVLGDGEYLGALAEVPVRLGVRGMVLHPFVWYLGAELPPFQACAEVAEAFWVPLSHLWDPANACQVAWNRDGARLLYPAIGWRGEAIWGLTFRVLTQFSDVIDAPLPHLEPAVGGAPARVIEV